MRFLFLTMFLVSCGVSSDILPHKEHKHKKIIQVDELNAYIDMFERDSAKYGDAVVIDDLIMGFGIVDFPDDDSVTLGVCSQGVNQTPEIIIEIKYWDLLSSVRKKSLIYHELGHCVLNRGHVPDPEDDGYDSIMNPTLISTEQYEFDPEYFLEELFDLTYRDDWLSLQEGLAIFRCD